MVSSLGRMARSKTGWKPTGVNREPTRWIGASKYWNSSEPMMPAISAPKPEKTLSSCTINTLLVFLTPEGEEFKKQIRPILDQVYVHAEHIIGIENVETMLSELKAVHNVLENI